MMGLRAAFTAFGLLVSMLCLTRGTSLAEPAPMTGATSQSHPEESSPVPWHQVTPRPFARAIRGVTVGPIENSLHSHRGYGSPASAHAMRSAVRLGANWVSLTPFGRVWDLEPSGVNWTFETDFELNRQHVERAIEQAHAEGLKVLLVPHLWVETGEWRALIDFPTDSAWEQWFAAYRDFLLAWATVAERHQVELFSAGVEWRSWVTTTRAASFVQLLQGVRQVYSGKLTYAANWDDVETTVILGELDVIGINAFYPLAHEDGATFSQLLAGGQALAERVGQLARRWRKPVLFTETGYTSRPNTAIRPWEWPDSMTNVQVDETAQAEAYLALLAELIDEPWFLGFFVWRLYADAYDCSQEAPWGFSPLHKQAELVLRDAFAQPFGYEGRAPLGFTLAFPGATHIGDYR